MGTMKILLVLCSAVVSLAEVVNLTDSNFEHLTQAATGGTTGDWFVKFYAPWCGHCKALAPIWDEASESEDKPEGLNYAHIDCDGDGRMTCSRFDVKGFPTLLYLSKGKLYDFEGARSLEGISKYVEGELFKESEGKDVPPPPTFVEVLQGYLYQIPHWDSILIVLAVIAAIFVYKTQFAEDKKKKKKKKMKKNF